MTDAPVAHLLVRVLFALAGLAAALFALWVAFDELTAPYKETWFGLLIISIVPMLVGMGHLLPELIFARGPAQRTRVIAAPFWTVCEAIFVLLAAIAAGTYIRGWQGAMVGAAVGAIMAAGGISSMRALRRALDRPAEEIPASVEAPTRRQIGWALVKLVVVWVAGLVFTAGLAYMAAGRTGVFISLLLMVAVTVLLFAQALHRLRQQRGHPE